MEAGVGASSARVAYLARQPIYDRKQNVFAYELLYRNGHTETAGVVGLPESASTIVNALLEIGLERLVGNRIAFLNVPTELFLSDYLHVLPKNQIVLEVLESSEPTEELMRALNRLKGEGFKIAVDDYCGQESLQPFLSVADIVKVDVLSLSVAELQRTANSLKGRFDKVLAEKIESRQAFEICRHLGFDLFQGFFFARPSVVEEHAAACNRPALLALLAKLQDPEVNIQDLERIIESDITLSYRLLRFLRSAAAAVDQRVGSVRQAVLLLGLKKTSAIAAVLALSGIADIPSDLLNASLLRARMCEEVAAQLKIGNPDRYFTVGLLSFLDLLLAMPMKRIVEQLPLEEDVVEALVDPNSENSLRSVLRYVEAVEAGNWSAADECQVGLVSPVKTYLDSLSWAEDIKLAA